MTSDKFDFTVAEALVNAVEQTILVLEQKNDEINHRFKDLHDGFKDSEYDVYSLDMGRANSAIKEVMSQLRSVSIALKTYADRLRDATK